MTKPIAAIAPIALLSAALPVQFSADAAALDGKVRRPARLFVAGDYPDKGLTVTREDLAGVVARFNAAAATVPVKSEHTDGPLDPLGEVVALHLDGDELYGMLVFSAGMDAHIRERGVEHVSICLVREPEGGGDGGYRLKETSLVFKPRVPSAGFLDAAAVEAKIAQFRVGGKVTPAMEPHVRRLLSAPQQIAFADGSAASVAGLVDQLLAAMPVIQPREGAAGAPAAGSTFAAGGGSPAVPADVDRYAAAFGLDPKKVRANFAGIGGQR